MGYYVSTHLVKGDVVLERLAGLPDGLLFKAYESKDVDVLMLDFYLQGREARYPFQSDAPSKVLPLELPENYSNLEILYAKLRKAKVANSFKRALVNLNLNISQLLATEVFSFAADDDELDFSILSASGLIKRLRFIADDIDVIYENNKIDIFPLLTENEEELVDLSLFEDSHFNVHARETEYPMQMHYVAAKESDNFISGVAEFLGLSTFDPEVPELRELTSVSTVQDVLVSSLPIENVVSAVSTEPSKKSWWQFWK